MSEDVYTKSIRSSLALYPYLVGYCKASRMSTKSLRVYLNRIIQYIHYLEAYQNVRIHSVEELKDYDLNCIHDFLLGSTSSSKSKHYALKSLFNYLEVDKNPMVELHPVRVEKNTNFKVLSEEEIRQVRKYLLSTTNKQNVVIFDLMYHTGIRLSEIVDLKVDDVKEHCIWIKDRRIALSKKLEKEIRECMDVEYVFVNRNQNPISIRAYEKLLEKCPVKINPQMIRDTYAFHSLEKKVPILVSSKQMGISVTTFANRYLK